jgi:curli biogenesis system outer membrane secretion channel CsgG
MTTKTALLALLVLTAAISPAQQAPTTPTQQPQAKPCGQPSKAVQALAKLSRIWQPPAKTQQTIAIDSAKVSQKTGVNTGAVIAEAITPKPCPAPQPQPQQQPSK